MRRSGSYDGHQVGERDGRTALLEKGPIVGADDQLRSAAKRLGLVGRLDRAGLGAGGGCRAEGIDAHHDDQAQELAQDAAVGNRQLLGRGLKARRDDDGGSHGG